MSTTVTSTSTLSTMATAARAAMAAAPYSQGKCTIGLEQNDKLRTASQEPVEQLLCSVTRDAYNSIKAADTGYAVLDANFARLEKGVDVKQPEKELAQLGISAMLHRSVPTLLEQDRIGHAFMRAHKEISEGPSQAVASTVLAAFGRTTDLSSGYGVLDAGLRAAAAGIGGAMAPALGQVGLKALYNDHVATLWDQTGIAVEFTEAIIANEPALAAQGQQAMQQYEGTRRAADGLAYLGAFLQTASNFTGGTGASTAVPVATPEVPAILNGEVEAAATRSAERVKKYTSVRYNSTAEMYDSTGSMYNSSKAQYNSAASQYDPVGEMYNSSASQYNSSRSQYNSSRSQYNSSKSQYDHRSGYRG